MNLLGGFSWYKKCLTEVLAHLLLLLHFHLFVVETGGLLFVGSIVYRRDKCAFSCSHNNLCEIKESLLAFLKGLSSFKISESHAFYRYCTQRSIMWPKQSRWKQ